MLSMKSVKTCRSSWGKVRRDSSTCTISCSRCRRRRNNCRLSSPDNRFTRILSYPTPIISYDVLKLSHPLCGASFQQDLCFELQKEKQTLETHVGELKDSVAEQKEYVQSLKERERFLVAFPELSPPAQAQPQSRQIFYFPLSYNSFLHNKIYLSIQYQSKV